jgi:hypothetical protein
MNRKYDKNDRERDQSRGLEQGEAEKRKARQDGMQDRAQQRSEDEPRRQQAGGGTVEDGRTGASGERIVDEP